MLILQSSSFKSQEEDHCCPEKLMLFSYGTTAITDSRLHTGDVQAKSKIFTASEKQPAPVATDGADSRFQFEWVQKDLAHSLTRLYVLSSGAFCLLIICNFSKKLLGEEGRTLGCW